MVIAMFLAHLFGDYILQWNSLAAWKSREQKGVLAHASVVLLVTWLFSLPFNSNWSVWVLFIGLSHLTIDSLNLFLSQRFPALNQGMASLARFAVDQTLHLTIIFLALILSGYLSMPVLPLQLATTFHQYRLLAYLLGYAFLMMPSWVILKFLIYGFMNNSAPNFAEGCDKYVGSLERWMITTLVILGQYMLVPLVAVPRLVFEGRNMFDNPRLNLYLAELLASITLAIVIGLGLKQL